LLPPMGTQEREVYMTIHKLPPIEECLQQIQEAFEQIPQIQKALEAKPDRDDLENGLSDVLFKLEENNDDVRALQDEVAEVSAQVDDLQSEDR
jgi:predicted  nucleic acid-binding Zn-ribbon protein